ncbi:TPA: hypothetical protein ACH3X2_000966 [Trebouxia sp. C0005]
MQQLSSSASGGELAELKEKLKGWEEQKAAEMKKEKGTRDLELLVGLNKDLDRTQVAITALSSGIRGGSRSACNSGCRTGRGVGIIGRA